jgi:predicted metal-dependent phosphoesterase TrpH
VSKHALSPEAGVELIRAAGGAAVLAHPGLGSREAQVDVALLERLIGVGLAGVEADHYGHDEQTKVFWREAALDRGLVVTGASDFHGPGRDSSMGIATTPVEGVQRLRNAAQRGARLMKEGARW